MAIIYETANFTLETHEKPEVDRLDGGHLKINPKVKVRDRTELKIAQLIELAKLTALAGKAFVKGMAERGIEIGRINYQDNGNWKPELHIHLYGRAIKAKYQKFGDPIIPGHKPEYQPLNDEDIKAIQRQIEIIKNNEQGWDI